jgi:hypothetical protein
VLSTFRKHQQQFQELVKGLQGIALPLTGDDAAVKKYAGEVEALKKKIGMPDVEDVINAELNYKMKVAGADVRKFVASAAEELKGAQSSAMVAEVMAAVEAAEAASGAALGPGNDKGWQAFNASLGEIEKKFGLVEKAKVKEEAIFEMYKEHIKTLRETVSVHSLGLGRGVSRKAISLVSTPQCVQAPSLTPIPCPCPRWRRTSTKCVHLRSWSMFSQTWERSSPNFCER